MHARFLEIESIGACPYRCRHCYSSIPGLGQLWLAEVARACAGTRGLKNQRVYARDKKRNRP